MGTRIGVRNYSKEEVQEILAAADDIVPLGSVEWVSLQIISPFLFLLHILTDVTSPLSIWLTYFHAFAYWCLLQEKVAAAVNAKFNNERSGANVKRKLFELANKAPGTGNKPIPLTVATAKRIVKKITECADVALDASDEEVSSEEGETPYFLFKGKYPYHFFVF